MSELVSSGVAPLPDGRRLAYVAVGPADGLLVLYLHGAIGSPQEVTGELQAVMCELAIRYVMVSRPGFGGSDRAPGRTLLDFADDAGALACHLGHERFAVAGVSAGGPYALACAHSLPQRVVAAAVVSGTAQGAWCPEGLPPAARIGLRVVRGRPRTCEHAGDALLDAVRRHPRLVARVTRGRPAARFLAAAGGGVGGMIDDHLVTARPWGFGADRVPGLVQVWHGAQDGIVPVDEAMLLAATLPHARLAVDPGEGHFFYRRRLREILGDLAAAAAAATATAAADAPAARVRPGA